MRRPYSARLGVLLALPVAMTAALTGLLWAEEPASQPPAAKSAIPGAGAASNHMREVQRALTVAGYASVDRTPRLETGPVQHALPRA